MLTRDMSRAIDVATIDEVALELAARLFEKIWSPSNAIDPMITANRALTAAEAFAAAARAR